MPLVTHPDGSKLAFQVEGDGDPVVLIQGVGVPGSGWRPQIDRLKGRYRVVAPDNRGVGQSDFPAEPLSIEGLASDVLFVMDELDIERAHVCGHSMGGVIAQKLALLAPKRVRSLHLQCTFPRGKDATALSPWIMWVGMRLHVGTRRMRRNAFMEMILPKGLLATSDLDELARRLEPIFGRDLAEQPSIVMKQMSAMRAHDELERLSELSSIPTAVLTGAEDRIAPPRLGRQIADAIVDASYTEVQDAAHGVPIMKPGIVTDAMTAHFEAAS